MSTDIRVPMFTVRAGDGRITVTRRNEWEELWDFEYPNHVNVSPKAVVRSDDFDRVRALAEGLADVMASAEEQFQALHDQTSERVGAVLDSFRERETRIKKLEDRP